MPSFCSYHQYRHHAEMSDDADDAAAAAAAVGFAAAVAAAAVAAAAAAAAAATGAAAAAVVLLLLLLLQTKSKLKASEKEDNSFGPLEKAPALMPSFCSYHQYRDHAEMSKGWDVPVL